MANTNILKNTYYPNNSRTISGLGNNVYADDVSLNCNTLAGPVEIDLALIPANSWNTVYKLYVTDISNNAATNNITINAPSGFTINGLANYVISQNGISLQLFISSNTKYGISNAVNAPVTSQVDNTPFGPSWAGVTALAPSKNAVYNEIITIGTGFGNTAYVRKGGNDATAAIGNILKPFGTMAGAIYGTNGLITTGIGLMPGSTLDIDSGIYNIGDTGSGYEQCPQGLRPIGSQYDINMRVGAVINSYCTYGLLIMPDGTFGSIYGYGKIYNFSATITGTVNGIAGIPINISNINNPLSINFEFVEMGNMVNTVHFIRLNTSTGFSYLFRRVNIETNGGDIFAKYGGVLYLDSGYCVLRNTSFSSSGNLSNPIAANQGYAVKINNSICIGDQCMFTSGGLGYYNSNQREVIIVDAYDMSIHNTAVKLNNSSLNFAGSLDATLAVIRFNGTTNTNGRFILNNCILSSGSDILYNLNNALAVDATVACPINMINVSATRNVGSNISNSIPFANGFQYNSKIL